MMMITFKTSKIQIKEKSAKTFNTNEDGTHSVKCDCGNEWVQGKFQVNPEDCPKCDDK